MTKFEYTFKDYRDVNHFIECTSNCKGSVDIFGCHSEKTCNGKSLLGVLSCYHDSPNIILLSDGRDEIYLKDYIGE